MVSSTQLSSRQMSLVQSLNRYVKGTVQFSMCPLQYSKHQELRSIVAAAPQVQNPAPDWRPTNYILSFILGS